VNSSCNNLPQRLDVHMPLWTFIVMFTIEAELDTLSRRVLAGGTHTADTWRGAGVEVTSDPDLVSSDSFGRQTRTLITKNVGEMSWLLSNVTQIFSNVDGYNVWKEELVGRLALAANAATARDWYVTAKQLELVILREAYVIDQEMVGKTFRYLPFAEGNTIFADSISTTTGGSGRRVADAELFFVRRGLIL